MPFLRRRGVMASETDMHRRTMIDTGSVKPPAPDFLSPRSAEVTRDSVDSPQDDVHHTIDVGNGDNSATQCATLAPTSAPLTRHSEEVYDRPVSPPVQEETPRIRRFSMLRFRNASDSQLSARAKTQHQQQKEKRPPMPPPPAIITTAPTLAAMDHGQQKKSRMGFRIRRSGEFPRKEADAKTKKDRRKTMMTFSDEKEPRASTSSQPMPVELHPPQSRPGTSNSPQDGVQQANRPSESDKSEGSSGDRHAAGSATNGSRSASSTSIFRLSRRKPKQPEPLFPISHLPQKSKTSVLQPVGSSPSLVHRDSTSSGPAIASALDPSRVSFGHDGAKAHGALARLNDSPATALFRPASRNSGQSSPTQAHHLHLRGRSSTMSSLGRTSFSVGRNSVDEHQKPGTSRTSSSTIGRKSFGDLLGLGRLRQNNGDMRHGSLTPLTPGSSTSKNNSFQLAREKEPVALPERREDDTPAKYLARVEEVMNRGAIAAALSKGADPFSAAVLRSYMRTFGFFEEPMDMAIRKLLMEAELPKETQQIDRCLQAFANRYHECNPGIYSTPDQAYFIAFSLLILHTDVFNKNNKNKMQKPDYIKNTRGEGVGESVLECFYDNITYTPFIHVDDDSDANGERAWGPQAKKKTTLTNGTQETLKRSKDPVDPYTLIIDGNLDSLRPPLKDQIPMEEHYSYIGTAKSLNLKELQRTFFKTGVLQIVSARSRPDAFMTEKTLTNPQEAHPGIVDIKITKVGTLWRKDQKKKKARSPWQEWGAILTGNQLYFFRNMAWIKNLIHQYEHHLKQGLGDIPLIFKPPLEQFQPDALMSTDGAVALWDTTYKKHKNAFVYVRHGGFEEVLLAQSEDDRNDWLAKLNYAAAFRTSGVRMRGVIGGNFDGRRAFRRLDSSEVTQVIQTPTGEVSINRSRIDHKMAEDILAARREIMQQRIAEADEKLQAAQRQLDNQLRDARHLLILAPIQEKTRDGVRLGAARLIAQLKWSRTEIWRLKCHRDILKLDLDEEKEVNGNLEEAGRDMTPSTTDKASLVHTESKGSSRKSHPQPGPLVLAPSSEFIEQVDGGSAEAEIFQTPPSSATTSNVKSPFSLDSAQSQPEHVESRKQSVTSGTGSPATVSSSPRLLSSPGSGQDRRSNLGEDRPEDADERRILEEAGLLEVATRRTSDYRPSSVVGPSDETADRSKRTSASISDKNSLDRTKIRRSLQRTLREGTGHLSHHRSRRGRDSASTVSDENARDDKLTRTTGSFVVHGKKASVINFGSELQSMSTDERLRQRKQSQADESLMAASSTIEDVPSMQSDELPDRERRESAASGSTATAKSFRELHRRYSQNRTVAGGLVVPSDDDSDAAVSFSDGRRTPLPPVEDGSGGEDEVDGENKSHRKTQFFDPLPASPQVEEGERGNEGEGETSTHPEAERLPSSNVQVVKA